MTKTSNLQVAKRDDGYTLSRYIAGSFGMYDPVSFDQRPTTIESTAWYDDQIKGKSDTAVASITAKMLSSMIVGWDYKKPGDDNVAPITEQTMLSLHPFLFYHLRNIVCVGQSGGDRRPEDSSGPSSSSDDAEKDLLEILRKN